MIHSTRLGRRGMPRARAWPPCPRPGGFDELAYALEPLAEDVVSNVEHTLVYARNLERLVHRV